MLSSIFKAFSKKKKLFGGPVYMVLKKLAFGIYEK